MLSSTSSIVFACMSKACAPPPVGTGGSRGGAGGGRSTRTTGLRSKQLREGRIAGVGKGLSEPDSGFTKSTQLRDIRSGFSVALKGSDVLIDSKDAYLPDGSVNPKMRKMIKDRLSAALGTNPPKGTKVALGGWHNPEDGKIEINVSIVFPKNMERQAREFAVANDQIAMAKLHPPFEIIMTGGTGGDRAIAASAVLKDPKGGLTPAGRKAFGGNLKPGVKDYTSASDADKQRWISWARRFYARKTYPPFIDKNGEPTRFALTARAWGEPVPKNAADARRIAAKAAVRQKELDNKRERSK
jgi:hypothetical protein